MKYSEAIRLGSMLYPQCVGSLIISEGPGYRVCANGAASLALGVSERTLMLAVLASPVAPRRIKEICSPARIGCPACAAGSGTVLAICSHLNDQHSWTRERIADWLAASGHDFEIDLSAAVPEPAPVSEVFA